MYGGIYIKRTHSDWVHVMRIFTFRIQNIYNTWRRILLPKRKKKQERDEITEKDRVRAAKKKTKEKIRKYGKPTTCQTHTHTRCYDILLMLRYREKAKKNGLLCMFILHQSATGSFNVLNLKMKISYNKYDWHTYNKSSDSSSRHHSRRRSNSK